MGVNLVCSWSLWYQKPTKGNYNADLDRRPYREVDRRSYSVAVSTGVGRVRRVQLLTVPCQVGLRDRPDAALFGSERKQSRAKRRLTVG